VVSADRLVELLWGDDLPGGVTNALQSATLDGLAGACLGEGDPALAATLVGTARAARERQGALQTAGARLDAGRVDAAARAALGDDRHADAVAAGRALSPHEALALAGVTPDGVRPDVVAPDVAQPADV
jgi:hypothetical protein